MPLDSDAHSRFSQPPAPPLDPDATAEMPAFGSRNRPELPPQQAQIDPELQGLAPSSRDLGVRLSVRVDPPYLDWLFSFADHLCCPASILVDAALSHFALSKGYAEPPPQRYRRRPRPGLRRGPRTNAVQAVSVGVPASSSGPGPSGDAAPIAAAEGPEG